MTGYLHWRDFADDALIELARDTAIKHRDRFTDTTVTTGDPNYRRSKVLWDQDYPDLYSRFTQRLRLFLPNFRSIAAIPDDLDIELQLTAHNDGAYFKRHVDNGSPDTKRRLLTYVFYFNLVDGPPGFTGGDLLLENDGKLYSIPPTHNTIIVFPPHWYHEVKPVSVESKRWEDSRMTCNGWIRTPIKMG